MPGITSSDLEEQPKLDESEIANRLVAQGFVLIPQRFCSIPEAWALALSVSARARDLAGGPTGNLEVVGEFNLPPSGTAQREFQALHVDFGFPRLGADTVDIALYTALYIAVDQESSGTATRLAPLHLLLPQRPWPKASVINHRLRCTSGNGRDVEGILARIIESVDRTHDLPAQDDNFLCGMEFSSIDEEEEYFRQHGIRLQEAEQSIVLSSGELLLFDNLAIAHGRHGRRTVQELHQLCIGFKAVERAGQSKVIDALVARFKTDAARACAAV